MNNSDIPEVLACLSEITNDAIKEHDIPDTDADEISSEVVNKMAKRFGGETVYFPQNFHFNRAKRNEGIFKALDNGVPCKEVARKYKLSSRRIRQIDASR